MAYARLGRASAVMSKRPPCSICGRQATFRAAHRTGLVGEYCSEPCITKHCIVSEALPRALASVGEPLSESEVGQARAALTVLAEAVRKLTAMRTPMGSAGFEQELVQVNTLHDDLLSNLRQLSGRFDGVNLAPGFAESTMNAMLSLVEQIRAPITTLANAPGLLSDAARMEFATLGAHLDTLRFKLLEYKSSAATYMTQMRQRQLEAAGATPPASPVPSQPASPAPPGLPFVPGGPPLPADDADDATDSAGVARVIDSMGSTLVLDRKLKDFLESREVKATLRRLADPGSDFAALSDYVAMPTPPAGQSLQQFMGPVAYAMAGYILRAICALAVAMISPETNQPRTSDKLLKPVAVHMSNAMEIFLRETRYDPVGNNPPDMQRIFSELISSWFYIQLVARVQRAGYGGELLTVLEPVPLPEARRGFAVYAPRAPLDVINNEPLGLYRDVLRSHMQAATLMIVRFYGTIEHRHWQRIFIAARQLQRPVKAPQLAIATEEFARQKNSQSNVVWFGAALNYIRERRRGVIIYEVDLNEAINQLVRLHNARW